MELGFWIPTSRYNVFKAPLIVAYGRSSNLSDFLLRAKLRNLTRTTNPEAIIPVCKKTILLANTYLTYKLHTHSSLQVKPDLSPFTSAATLKKSFTWYSDTTSKKLNDDTQDRFKEHRRPVDDPSNISKPSTVS